MRSFGLCLKLQLSLLTGRVAERFGNPFHPALESESQHPMTNVLSRFFRSLAEAAETKGADLPEWNLDDLYPGMDSPALKSDLDEARGRAEAFKERWRGHLAELAAQDPSDLAASVREFEALEELLGRVISYAGLVYAGDTSDPVRAKFYGDIQAIITDISTHLLFYTLELNRIEDEVMDRAMASESALGHYRPWLVDLRKDKPYQLEDRVEELFRTRSLEPAVRRDADQPALHRGRG